MIKFIFFLTIIFNSIDFDHKKKSEIEDLFIEIEWFIEKVEKDIELEGNIYMVKIFSGERFCYTISYNVREQINEDKMSFKYFAVLNGRLVLFKSTDGYSLSNLSKLKRIEDDTILRHKVSKNIIGMGTYEGYLVCKSYDEYGFEIIEKTFYENSDNIPDEMKIFKTPQNNFIELDSIQQIIVREFIRKRDYNGLKKFRDSLIIN